MTGRTPFRQRAGGSPPAGVGAGEVLFEFVIRGNFARCAAIDAATGVEVVAIGPAAADEAHLKAVALRKLRWRMTRG
jgi:hypothetical protein